MVYEPQHAVQVGVYIVACHHQIANIAAMKLIRHWQSEMVQKLVV